MTTPCNSIFWTLVQIINRCQWEEAIDFISSHSDKIQNIHNHNDISHIYQIFAKFKMMYKVPNQALPLMNVWKRIHDLNPSLTSIEIILHNHANNHNNNTTPLHSLLYEYGTYSYTQPSFSKGPRCNLYQMAIMVIESNPNSLLHPLVGNGFLPLHDFIRGYTLSTNIQSPPWLRLGLHSNHFTDNDYKHSNGNGTLCNWNNLIYKVLQTKPQSLITPNKGGVTCFEMFWDAFAYYHCPITINNNDHNNNTTQSQLSVEVARQWYYYENQDNVMLLFDCTGTTTSRSSLSSTTTYTKYTKYYYYWIIYLVKIAFLAILFGDDSDGSNDEYFLPIHSILYIPCAPIEMIQFVLSVHGNDELLLLDSISGNSPLHIAVTDCATSTKHHHHHHPTSISTCTHLSKIISNIKRSKEDTLTIIQMILKINPITASIQNKDGYFPFFVGLKNGNISWDHGLSDILESYLDVIHHVDPVYHFNAFIYASVCIDSNECGDDDHVDTYYSLNRQLTQLNNTYQILVKFPHLIHFNNQLH